VRGDEDVKLAEVLVGAGLDEVDVTPELARDLGRILRTVVAGVMDVLQSRQRIKDEFRLPVTTFQRAANNPLKFSADVDDALHNLLVRRNAAYLGPVEAFDDAFNDIRNHQMAMLEGVRVAFDAMLAEFNPDHLQEMFDRTSKKGVLVAMPAKLRYWELYREKIHDMAADADRTFRSLFGDEFARAYEEQLKRLKAEKSSDKS
jgi:type VI secretion system FHA domain protein